jgi:hypothetical protein
MKINIVKNEGLYNDMTPVIFSSEFGEGKAFGKRENAIEGKFYFA